MCTWETSTIAVVVSSEIWSSFYWDFHKNAFLCIFRVSTLIHWSGISLFADVIVTVAILLSSFPYYFFFILSFLLSAILRAPFRCILNENFEWELFFYDQWDSPQFQNVPFAFYRCINNVWMIWMALYLDDPVVCVI